MNGRRVSTIVYFSLVAFNKQSKSFQSFRNVFFWGELQQTENQPAALHKPIKTSGEEEIRDGYEIEKGETQESRNYNFSFACLITGDRRLYANRQA